jgi:CSLREA domain-containing protein
MSVFTGTATAATITVNTLNDELNADGDCSLREAIQAANTDAIVDTCVQGAGTDIINVPAGTLSMTLGQFTLSRAVTINGAGIVTTTLDAQNASRIFDINDGSGVTSMTLSNMRLLNGQLNTGACVNNVENLTIDRVKFQSCIGSSAGGGLEHNTGSLLITDSFFIGNTGSNGGALRTRSGVATVINRVAIVNNLSSNHGAWRHDGGSLTVTNSTISGNRVTGAGAMTFTGGLQYLTMLP